MRSGLAALVLLAIPVLHAPRAAADSFNVTVTFASLASGFDAGRVAVDYEIPETVWGELKGFGVTPSLLVWGTRPGEEARTFVYALALTKRSGHLVTPATDWTGMDAYELEIGGWNKAYYVNLMRIGEDPPQRAFRWALNAAPAAEGAAPQPLAIDPRVVKTCHDELAYVDPGFVKQCTEVFAGIEGGSAVAAIVECKRARKNVGPDAIMTCLKQSAGR